MAFSKCDYWFLTQWSLNEYNYGRLIRKMISKTTRIAKYWSTRSEDVWACWSLSVISFGVTTNWFPIDRIGSGLNYEAPTFPCRTGPNLNSGSSTIQNAFKVKLAKLLRGWRNARNQQQWSGWTLGGLSSNKLFWKNSAYIKSVHVNNFSSSSFSQPLTNYEKYRNYFQTVETQFSSRIHWFSVGMLFLV